MQIFAAEYIKMSGGLFIIFLVKKLTALIRFDVLQLSARQKSQASVQLFRRFCPWSYVDQVINASVTPTAMAT